MNEKTLPTQSLTIPKFFGHIDENQLQNPFDMIEARFSQLQNMRKDEETLPTQTLTISDTSRHIDENQESWYLFDQDSVSPQNLELD